MENIVLFLKGVTLFCKKLCRHKNFLGVNANRLGILLRVRQGITFHFETIPFFVSPKILIFIGMKIRILDFGKKIDFFVNLF